METIKIVIKPLTPFYTPLQSDTLFGEFCWHYRFLYGKEKLENLINNYDVEPFIVFSSGFPEDYLPFPVIPFRNLPIVEKRDIETYKVLKKFKKQAFIEKKLLRELIESKVEITAEVLFENFLKESNKKETAPIYRKAKQMHVTIDRRFGSHLEGHLFDKEYLFFNKDSNIEIYCKFNPKRITSKEIEQTFHFMGLNGLGGEKTTGKGKFEIISIKESDLPETTNPNSFISLSIGMAKEDEIEDYYARFFTKFPKHGPEVCPEGINIFKNPVILTKEGSVFKYKAKKDIYGTIYKISQDESFIHCAKIFPLFVRLG
ncbi:type III-A CRISPR-associated RAMP protein Csm4 [Desulfurobacterium indicum]|uniref:CRISPR system Cms protein Csm4 n=1 Tax=Desulfurobacterium indicum TaxID=1914305 RepID=A0A1R1MKQ2_9BACT|nr:type III-A CRISPR-associated RAMP protein Csm4 [Desulfurobacterium indicum]OMH40391.1 type III-A CRISPR-associated RAMP protein Csm4 [Desulfurobacterium indicum]